MLQYKGKRSPRPEGLRAGVGFLGRGSEPSQSPPHQLQGLGEHCKLSHGVQGRTPENLKFGAT